jgi:hypothetical protein
VERHFFISQNHQRKNGRSKSSEEISRSSEGRWILRRCKEVTARTSERFKAQEGQSRRSESQGPSDLHVISCIGDSRVEAPSCCNENCDIAIRDIPTSPEPSIVGTRVRRSKEVGVRRIGVSRDRETLAAWNRETRYPDGRVVWATTGVSGGQVAYHIGDREKEVPNPLTSGFAIPRILKSR